MPEGFEGLLAGLLAPPAPPPATLPAVGLAAARQRRLLQKSRLPPR
ncbi:MAG: hypothetical protein R3D28_14670 [Geminicoccaceae bacterium]